MWGNEEELEETLKFFGILEDSGVNYDLFQMFMYKLFPKDELIMSWE